MRQSRRDVLQWLGATRPRRLAVCAMIGISAGLVSVFIVPAIYLAHLCASTSECTGPDAEFGFVMVTLLSHFITVPVAILVGSVAYVWLDTRLIAIAGLPRATVSCDVVSASDRWPPIPKTRVFRVAGVGWLSFLAVWGIVLAGFVYRKNTSCGPNNEPIASNMDAIVRAQKSISKARYLSQEPGYANDRPYVVDFGPTETCCSVTRGRTWFGVIVWHVSLTGETIGEALNRHVSAQILLSNCGIIFDEDSVVLADPITR